MSDRPRFRLVPPKRFERVLGWLLPNAQRDAALGDAAEEFARRSERDGPAAATRWYRRQVRRSVLPALLHRGGSLRNTSSRETTEAERMGALLGDFRLGLRALRRRPAFSLTVLTTLALGVGATTALYGVFRAVFLEPVALPDSDELVVIMEQGSFGCCGPASGPDYVDWVRRSRSFEHLAALSPGSFTLTGLDEAQRVLGVAVTASAFDVVGIAPLLGRPIAEEDQETSSVVVLSYDLWRNALGGSADVIGTNLTLNGRQYTVIGVMPEGFDVPSPWSQLMGHKLYVPFPNANFENPRGNHNYPVVARLADGVDKEVAQADMDRVMRELAAEYPDTNSDRSTKIFTIHEYLFASLGKQLGLILGAAGLVLLVACGNVAGLQLARAAAREGEMAVRAALGASRRALVRLLFSESLLLALLGGVGGVLVSLVSVDLLRAVLPSSTPRLDQIRIDGQALVFALSASAFTALVFGMLPALLASRGDLAGSVKQGGYGTLAPARERLRDAFIVGQIALGLVLANGAVLLVRSYVAVRGQEFGFDAGGVLTMSLNPAGPRYPDGSAYVAFYDEVSERVRAIPGVESVGTVSRLPMFGGSNGNVWVEGTPPRTSDGEGPLVEVVSVTGDYFEAMGIPLLQGRTLVADDSVTAAVGVVINERMAEQAWPDADPIGKRFSFSDDPPLWLTVVGVVGDVQQWGPEQPTQAQAYFPLTQGWQTGSYLTVRTSGDPTALAPAVREAILAVDPAQPPSEVRTMSDLMERTFAQRRFYTTLVTLFAAAALVLAAGGIYGTVSYFVARRTRELAIRVVLGAKGNVIMRLVVRRAVRLAIWGVLLGLVGVWTSTRVVEGLVFGVSASDPLTIVLGCAVLGFVAVASAVLPARRAVRVSPVLALKTE